MSKKRTSKRLEKLFDDIKQEKDAVPAKDKEPRTAGRRPVDQPRAEKPRKPRASERKPVAEAVAAPGSGTPDTPAALALGFRLDEEQWATLQVLDEEKPREWDPQDQMLVRQVADQLSLALENARLFQQTQARAEELAVLNEMSRALSANLDVSAVVENIFMYSSRLVDTRNFFVALYHAETQEMELALATTDGNRLEPFRRPVGKGLSDHVIRTGAPLLMNGDIPAQMKTMGLEVVALGNATPALSWLGVPMQIGNETIGVIAVQSITTPNLFNERHRDLLGAIASQSAIAIQNARSYERELKRRREADALRELAQIASASLEIHEVAQSLLERIPGLVPFNSATIQIVQPDGRRQQVGGVTIDKERTKSMASPSEHFLRPADEDPLIGAVVDQMQTVVLNDTHADPRWEVLPETKHIRSWLAAPLVSGQKTIGIMILDQSSPNAFTEDSLSLIGSIAAVASAAIQNASLFEQARLQAEELEVLNEVAKALTSRLDVDFIVRETHRGLSRLMDAKTFYIGLYDAETNLITFPITVNESVIDGEIGTMSADEGLTGYIIREHSPLLIKGNMRAEMEKLGIQVLGEPAASWLGVPLMIGDQVYGAMVVQNYTETNVYDEHDLDLMNAFASQAAIAIQNARLFQETRRRAYEVGALAQVANEIATSRELNSTLQQISDRAREFLNVTDVAIYLIDQDGQILHPVIAVGNFREQILASSVRIGEGLTGSIAKTGKAEVINDLAGDTRGILIPGTPEEDDENEVMMVAPIILRGKTIGTINVWRQREQGLFTAEELNFLVNISGQAAIGIDSARLYEETIRRADEMSALNEIITAASQTLDPQVLFDTVLRKVLESIKFDGGLITLFNNARGKLERVVRIGLPGKSPEDPAAGLENSLCAYVFRNEDTLFIDDMANGGPIDVAGEVEAGMHGYIGVPLKAKGRVMGTLCAFRRRAAVIDPTVVSLMEAIGRQIGFAIENASLFRQMEESEARFRDVALSSADWVWEMDPDFVYTFCSDRVFNVLGYRPDEVIGKRPTDFMPPEEADAAGEEVSVALASSERVQDLEMRQISKDGHDIFLSVSGVPIRDADGRLLGYRGVFKDITEQKQAENLQAAIYRIAETALASPTIEELIRTAHEAISSVVPAKNLYVALYDARQDLLSFPYYVDEHDSGWEPHRPGKGLTSYVLRSGKSLLATPEVFDQLEASGDVVGGGTRSVDWLGVPLRTKEATIGVLAVQSYDPRVRINEDHLESLGLLGTQVAAAIDRFQSARELAKFKLGLERSKEAAFITELDGTIIYANPAFTEIYGFSPEEAIGQTPRILKSGVIPQERYKEFWGTLLSKGTVSGEIINRTKDGRLVNIEGSNSPILDEQGEVVGFLAVHRDITARKQAEEQLRRQNEYLSAATEISRLVTSILDMDTVFDRAVNLIRDRLGYYHVAIFTGEETGFTAIVREATGEAGAQMKEARHSLQIGGKSIIGTVLSTGEAVIVNDTTSSDIHRPNPLLPDTRAEAGIPMRIGTRIIGALDLQATDVDAFGEADVAILQTLADQIAVAIDNTRSYELAQQAVSEMRELDRIKSQFLANMSHELRTPLNSIIGFSRVILKGIDGPVTELQQQDLTAIYNSGQHLLGLINDILDLSKIEAGKMELAFDEVHLPELITSVMSTVTGLVKDRPVKLVNSVPGDLPSVRADQMRVRQIMINLLSNAAKFTEEGSITVDAAVQTGPAGRPEIVINVTDTGPGIAPEDQDKLFQAFSQVDASPTRKTGGTGLGLAISQQLVQMHGGRIGLHSEMDKGSTFYFTLPVYRGKEDSPADRSSRVILSIDDDPQVVNMYERYLQPQGYQVIALTDPARAIERVKQLKPYAVTLDIMMPGYDGWQVINDLKSDPETRDVPVIICSIVEERNKGFSLGAADYLVKPILEEDLLEALNRLNSDGSIRELLVIDDDPDDLRLISKILNEHGNFKVSTAEGGKNGWDTINARAPHAIILDLFMPDMDGFAILEKLRASRHLRDIPVIIVTGGDLGPDEKKRLLDLGNQLLQKGSLSEAELLASLESALKRVGPR